LKPRVLGARLEAGGGRGATVDAVPGHVEQPLLSPTPIFWELLRFLGDHARAARALPDWDRRPRRDPRASLLPNLIISNRITAAKPIYRYVGATCVSPGSARDPTGERAYADILRGAPRALPLHSLSQETLTRRRPGLLGRLLPSPMPISRTC